jgi:hypothetical protein
MKKEQIVRSQVVILSSGSLFSEGVASRLREHVGRVQVTLLDPRLPDLSSQLADLHPVAVILDAADPWVVEKCPLHRLMGFLPGARIVELDSQAQQVRVVTSECFPARDVNDLVEVIGGHLPA